MNIEPTPVQPLVVHPEDCSFTFNINFLIDKKYYTFTYNDEKMAVRKVDDHIELYTEEQNWLLRKLRWFWYGE